jgi:hypothetical protein
MKTFNVQFSVPEQVCRDILCTAIEGGSVYWLTDYDGIDSQSEPSADGKYQEYVGLKIGDPTPGSEAVGTPPVRRVINCEAIAQAIGHLIQRAGQKGACHERYVGELIGSIERGDDGSRVGCSADNTTADLVLQMAVFNEVIYG